MHFNNLSLKTIDVMWNHSAQTGQANLWAINYKHSPSSAKLDYLLLSPSYYNLSTPML